MGTTKLELTWKNVLVTKGILFQRQRPRTTPRRCRKNTLKKGLCIGIPCACCADERTVDLYCHVNDMRQYRPQAPGPTYPFFICFLECLRRLVITSPFHSLRSYRLVPSPFFGTRLRRLNFNLAPPIASVVSLGAVFSIVTQRSTAESFRSLVSKWSLNPVTRGLVEHENFNIGIT